MVCLEDFKPAKPMDEADLESFLLERSMMINECQQASVEESVHESFPDKLDEKDHQESPMADETKLDISEHDFQPRPEAEDDYYRETPSSVPEADSRSEVSKVLRSDKSKSVRFEEPSR